MAAVLIIIISSCIALISSGGASEATGLLRALALVRSELILLSGLVKPRVHRG